VTVTKSAPLAADLNAGPTGQNNGRDAPLAPDLLVTAKTSALRPEESCALW
jgi:hypothetical protein